MTGPAPAAADPIDPAEPVPGWAVQLLVATAEIRRDLAPVVARVDDHEHRLRALERRAYVLAGGAAVVGAGTSQLLDLIQTVN
jgi:hypothetical protein